MDYTPETLKELAKDNKWDRNDLLAAADAWEAQTKKGNTDRLLLLNDAYDLRARLEAAEEKLALVRDVGFDYDGMASIEGLKQTIEKMVRIANGKAEENKP